MLQSGNPHRCVRTIWHKSCATEPLILQPVLVPPILLPHFLCPLFTTGKSVKKMAEKLTQRSTCVVCIGGSVCERKRKKRSFLCNRSNAFPSLLSQHPRESPIFPHETENGDNFPRKSSTRGEQREAVKLCALCKTAKRDLTRLLTYFTGTPQCCCYALLHHYTPASQLGLWKM